VILPPGRRRLSISWLESIVPVNTMGMVRVRDRKNGSHVPWTTITSGRLAMVPCAPPANSAASIRARRRD